MFRSLRQQRVEVKSGIEITKNPLSEYVPDPFGGAVCACVGAAGGGKAFVEIGNDFGVILDASASACSSALRVPDSFGVFVLCACVGAAGGGKALEIRNDSLGDLDASMFAWFMR